VRYLVTFYYWLVFVPTIVFGWCWAVLLWLVMMPFDPTQKALHYFVTGWVFQYLRIWPGWSVKVLHRERLPKGPCVYVANHQSMADVVAVMGLATPYKFVSKETLFTVPIVGWTMKMLKYIKVERGKPHSMHEMVEECRAWIRRGVPVLIFPEGTYSADTTKLLPFKRGAFMVAIDEKVPLVPVLLRGTTELIHEDGPWMSPRARITVEVEEPMFPLDGETDEALAARTRRLFAEKLGKLAP
jgi:1-acyl-sn-glycerol-3-phosphate acyltransferase